jgi:uncharacterized membrane protein
MNRQAFLTRLREGLAGMAPGAADDVVADYEAHFAEGEASGRSEAEIAQALGDPGRLARELKAEAGLKRWEEKRSPNAAAGAVFAVLGLGAIDILILLPILGAVGGVLFGFSMACIGVFFAGGWVFGSGLLGAHTGTVIEGFAASPLQTVLAGLGLMSGSVAVGALLILTVVALINGLVWYGRLHYRLLKPAIEQ